MLSKISKLRSWHWLWIAPLVIGTFLSFRFANIYFKWNAQRDEVLGKLVTYKRQLDYLRNPLPAEERAGEATVGAVAIPSRIYDRNARLIGEFFAERRTLIPIEKLPEYLIQALISSEDRQFYEHEGIDYLAIVRAFIVNTFSFRIQQGGSTITQQLAKVLFTDAARTLDRKIFEYFCAREVEQNYTKREILEMYLNLVYMGHGNYGVESASQFFFGKSAADLTIPEAATLIGLLPSPKNYSPIDFLKNALRRQKVVLKAMATMKFLQEEDIATYVGKFRATWKVHTEGDKLVSEIGNFPDSAYSVNLAPFFLDHIRHRLLKHFDPDVLTKGGLRIYTTLDYKRQLAAQRALRISIDKQKKYYEAQLARLKKTIARNKKDKKDKKLEKRRKQLETAIAGTSGAFVAISPKTGYVLTMVGGTDFSSQNQFNRATKAKRPVGSIIKPFVYYAAIAQRIITPATMVEDKPLQIGKKKYSNPDNKFLGRITARAALRKGRDIPALRILRLAGVEEFRHVLADALDMPVARMRKRVPRDLNIALGEISFTPFEVATMYAILLNQGKRVMPRDLLRVEDHLGKTLWEEDEPAPEAEILDPIASHITLSMMQGTFQEAGVAGWVGALREKDPRYLPFEIAGMAGTTAKYRDAWFVGLTSDEASAIWIGTDDKHSLGEGRSGASLCSPVWISYVRTARKGQSPDPFDEGTELPGSVRENFCDETGGVPRATGLCPHTIKEQIFFEGTEPRSFCPLHLPDSEDLNLEQ